jgi:hypothetical protein
MNALSKQEIAELREGDIVYVRMDVRKPIGEFGTIHCRIHRRIRGDRITCLFFPSTSSAECWG